MGVFTFEDSHPTPIAATRLFNSFDNDTLLTKAAPEQIKSIETIEGDGGVGTIRKVTFTQGDAYVKQKVDLINKETLEYKYSIIEGDVIRDKITKVSYENKIVAADGGSTLNVKITFYTIDDAAISEEVVNEGKAKGTALFQAIIGYLLANPDA
jgi:hypothetical protein